MSMGQSVITQLSQIRAKDQYFSNSFNTKHFFTAQIKPLLHSVRIDASSCQTQRLQSISQVMSEPAFMTKGVRKAQILAPSDTVGVLYNRQSVLC